MPALRQHIASWGRRLLDEDWALVPLRLIVGFGFAAHGYAKLARGPAAFAPIVAALGFPAPALVAWATAVAELGDGILLMLGAFVVPLSLVLATILSVALFGIHLRYGFSSVRLKSLSAAGAEFGPVGYELSLLYLGALGALAFSESTPLSIDRLRFVRPLRNKNAARS
jgi:putative oxidoreductase